MAATPTARAARNGLCRVCHARSEQRARTGAQGWRPADALRHPPPGWHRTLRSGPEKSFFLRLGLLARSRVVFADGTVRRAQGWRLNSPDEARDDNPPLRPPHAAKVSHG